MREIKFRGKAKMPIADLDAEHFEHENGWVTGNLIQNNGRPWIVGNIVESDPEYIVQDFWVRVHPESVGQFTGLKDMNGEGIYEGDIFEYGGRKYVVKFDKERAGFYPFAKGDGCGCCEDEVVRVLDDCEIIGNIFENPELLEEAN